MSTHRDAHGYLTSHSAGGFLAGLLMGGLIGSGTMLFLAPQSGKKTRAKIQRDGLDLRDQMVQTVGDAVTLGRRHVRRTASRVRKQTKEMAQRGQDMVDGQSEIVGNAVEAEKAAVHDLANG